MILWKKRNEFIDHPSYILVIIRQSKRNQFVKTSVPDHCLSFYFDFSKLHFSIHCRFEFCLLDIRKMVKNKLKTKIDKKSKKIRNDQELIQSDPTSGPQNQKGNIDSSLRKARAVNRMNSSFTDRWSFSYYNI